MKKEFDPYYKWLGIPPRDQPPNHYRLLGIEVFEKDRDVIDAAANRVMAYLKDLAVGDEADYSQKLLNEVARARICLLNKDKKAAYDETLRGDLEAQRQKAEPAAAPPPPGASPPPLRPGETGPAGLDFAPERFPGLPLRPKPGDTSRPALAAPGKRKKPQTISPRMVIAIGSVALVLGVAVGLAVLLSRDGSRDTASAERAANPSADTGRPKPDAAPRAKSKLRPLGKDPTAASGENLPPLPIRFPAPGEGTETAKPTPGTPTGRDPDDPPAELPLDSGTAPAKEDTAPVTPLPQPPSEMPGLPKPETTPVPNAAPSLPGQGALRDLPAAVALPEPQSAGASGRRSLGRVHLPPGERCALKLRGSEGAFRGAQGFVLRNAQAGAAERDWEVLVRDAAAGSETPVAHLALDEAGQLFFEWLPAAGTQAAAPHLANCVLSLEAGSDAHGMALREPAKMPELTVDLEKPTSKEDWKLDAVPDPNAVQVELVGAGELKFSAQPSGAVSVEKGEVWVQIEDGGALLLLQVETSLKRTFQATVTPHLKLTADAKPERLMVKKLPQLLLQVNAKQQQLALAIQQMNQLLRRGAPTPQQRLEIEQQLPLSEKLLEETQAAYTGVQELEKLLKAQASKVRLQMRVFYNAEGSEVDLLHIGTRPEKPPEASGSGGTAKPAAPAA